MKKFLKNNRFNVLGILLAFCFCFLMSSYASPPGDKYTYGKRSSVTVTCDDSVTLVPNNLTSLTATMAVDTNCTIGASITNSIIGDEIVLKLTSDATDRNIAWGAGITATGFTLQSLSTNTILLKYDGSTFRQLPVLAFTQGSVSLTYNDTLSIDPAAYNVYVASSTLTGAVAYCNADDADSEAGDILILKLTASGANRTINFNTNFTAVDDSVLSGKTKVWQFVYDGSNFIQTSEVQVD